MTNHPHAKEPDRPSDSVEDVFRRIAAGLQIPLETLALEHDAGHDGIPAVNVTHAGGVPLIRVGATVLTTTQASILARRIRRTVAQQRAHGRWSLLRALVWVRLVDLVAHARCGLSRDAKSRCGRAR